MKDSLLKFVLIEVLFTVYVHAIITQCICVERTLQRNYEAFRLPQIDSVPRLKSAGYSIAKR